MTRAEFSAWCSSVRLLDGATGSMLRAAGMPAGVCSESWILSHPQLLLDLQRAYSAAGSDVIYAPTFGANRVLLGHHDQQSAVSALNRDLVQLSREAVGTNALLAGDMTTTGQPVTPGDDNAYAALLDIYREQGEALSDLEGMAPDVEGFSDDGRGVQSDDMMRQALLRAKALGKPIVAHCEVNSLLRGGYIHDGDYAKAHGHRGICSESEWGQIARDLQLVKETGCAYHVCHVSAKESAALIRKAKAEGLDVTCETGPHYLVMDDSDLQEDGRFKMRRIQKNPLRNQHDGAAGGRDGEQACAVEGKRNAQHKRQRAR